MNDKLKSAENTIHFIQKEHERVLHGLHMEIERLQQKCSDLQFALAYQTASADTEAELRSLITGLHVESDSSKELVLSLQAELEKSQQKVIELEEQLRWQELEKQNQLNIKEAKIQELIRGLNITSSDQKVQIDKTASSKSALSPYLKEDSLRKRYEKHYSSQMVLKPTLVPIVPGTSHHSSDLKLASADLNQSNVHGKKVLKNQLQRNRNLASNSMMESNKPWSVNTTRNNHSSLIRQESLPSDFKATVATLPPIQPARRPQCEVNVQSLAVDLDFVKTRQKKALNFATEQI